MSLSPPRWATSTVTVGEISADVKALIDIILGGYANASTMKRADVNGDGEVNIADVNALIDIILD